MLRTLRCSASTKLRNRAVEKAAETVWLFLYPLVGILRLFACTLLVVVKGRALSVQWTKNKHSTN